MHLKRKVVLFGAVLLVACLGAFFQWSVEARQSDDAPTSAQRLQRLTAVPNGYRSEALKLLTQEASTLARDLRLPEKLPITQADLVAAYVSPPELAKVVPGFGNITTSNYTYYFSVGSKFSFLVRTRLEEEYRQLRAEYLWPIRRMDTNAAYRLAIQFLDAASIDVAALTRECAVHVLAFTPEGPNGKWFVPLYWVYWLRNSSDGETSAASIELLEPTRTLRQMHVNISRYILRKPLEIRDADCLLYQTNAARVKEFPKPESGYSKRKDVSE
jgi:hypothetical protein